MVQAKDISERQFIDAVIKTAHPWGTSGACDVAEALGVPRKVMLAKARRLIKRKVIDGCGCGCGGNFSIVVEP